jgi:hypothetical protein
MNNKISSLISKLTDKTIGGKVVWNHHQTSANTEYQLILTKGSVAT